MANYGYTVGILRLTRRMKPKEYLPFNINDLESDRGLEGYVEERLRSLTGPLGHKNEKQASWFKVKEFQPATEGDSACPLIVEIEGGGYGKRYGRYDVTKQKELDPITGEQALTTDGHLFFVLNKDSSAGLVIAETEGIASHLSRVLQYLNRQLTEQSLALRLEREVVDTYAWEGLLEDDETHIASVRLTKPNMHGDGTGLGGRGVKNPKIELGLEAGSDMEKLVAKETKRSIKEGHPTFVSLLTNGKFEDDDFGEASITTVNDGRERTLRVSQNFPRFVYHLSDKERPSLPDLLTASRSVALDALSALEIPLPKGVWPR